MDLNPVLQRFGQRSPLPVMARAVLERCLNAQDLDAWFERVAQAQYTKTLLVGADSCPSTRGNPETSPPRAHRHRRFPARSSPRSMR